MFGAIVGDTLGSIYEEVPNHPRRLSISPTDDSVLTAACYEWCQELTLEKISPEALALHSVELTERAAFYLKKWFWLYSPHLKDPLPEGQLAPTFESGDILGFSKSFTRWAQEKEYTQAHKKTNGALMRQSPIAAWCVKNGVPLSTCIELSRLFASPTHDDPTVYDAARKHIEVLYRCLETPQTTQEFHDLLLPYVKPEPLALWRERSMEFFIWNAEKSWEIVGAALLGATSFEEAFDNCVLVGGDVDTYAAIMGPIAEAVWGIPEHMARQTQEVLKIHPYLSQYFGASRDH